MIAALALALMLAAVEPAKAPVHAAPKADPCKALDAASNPTCADRAARQKSADPPPEPQPEPERDPRYKIPDRPAPAPAVPPATNAPPAAAPKAVARPKPVRTAAPPGKPPTPASRAMSLVRERPILVGGASGLIVLLVVGVTAVGIGRARRGASAAGPPASAQGSAPTRWRRDLVLTDQDGRDWRIAGAHLTPSAVVGAAADCELRRSEPGIEDRHAEFWVRDGRLMVRRLADPMFLNDRRLTDITPEVVSTGDQLRLGSTAFTITID